MSNRLCNHCILKLIQRDAEKENLRVSIKDATFNKIKDFNNGSPGVDVFVEDVFVAWMMNISDNCEC